MFLINILTVPYYILWLAHSYAGCTLAECIWRESRPRVAWDNTGRVRLSTLLPRALSPQGWEQGKGVQTRAWPYQLIKILVFLFQNFGVFFEILVSFFEILTCFFSKFWVFFWKLRLFWMYLSPISVRWVCRWFWRVTRDDSQARHETLWLVHRGPLKRETLTRRDTSAKATRENPRRGECSHLHSRSRLVSGSLGENVQPALCFYMKFPFFWELLISYISYVILCLICSLPTVNWNVTYVNGTQLMSYVLHFLMLNRAIELKNFSYRFCKVKLWYHDILLYRDENSENC